MASKPPIRFSAALVAMLCLIAFVPAAQAGGHCAAVSAISTVSVATVPVTTVQTLGVPVVAQNHCAAVSTVSNFQQLAVPTVHVQQFAVQAVPVYQQAFVQQQAFVVQAQNHCVQQRGVVVTTRVRPERRGIGRRLFGR